MRAVTGSLLAACLAFVSACGNQWDGKCEAYCDSPLCERTVAGTACSPERAICSDHRANGWLCGCRGGVWHCAEDSGNPDCSKLRTGAVCDPYFACTVPYFPRCDCQSDLGTGWGVVQCSFGTDLAVELPADMSPPPQSD
jgi:hypothetical protein